MALEKEITKNKVVLLVVSGESFNDSIFKIVKNLSKKHNICYVSVNKGYSALVDSFKKKKIDLNKFFFIDCITPTLLSPKKEKLCKFISSPNALTELSLALNDSQATDKDLILIDSLSTLAIYHSAKDIAHFVNSLSQKIKANKKTSEVLLISSGDKGKDVFNECEILVDKVIEVK
jgi:archaellum biogenesis ATPase FlaH